MLEDASLACARLMRAFTLCSLSIQSLLSLPIFYSLTVHSPLTLYSTSTYFLFTLFIHSLFTLKSLAIRPEIDFYPSPNCYLLLYISVRPRFASRMSISNSCDA